MQTKKHEEDEYGQTEKNPIASNEDTLVSRPFLFVHTRSCTFARRALLLMTLCVLVVAFPTPTVALASNPLGPKGASVSLDFEQTYKLDKKTFVHKGVDLSAVAGSTVSAPCPGTVSFVGDVPAGDSSLVAARGSKPGKTMRAVSICIKGGKTVTFMPFSKSSVSVGQTVKEGEQLGVLASSGDRSSSKTHLHMGLKKGSTYFDPKCLLGIVTGSTAEANVPVHQAVSKVADRVPATREETTTSIESTKANKTEKVFSGEQELEGVGTASVEDPMENIKTISSDVPSGSFTPAQTPSEGLLPSAWDKATDTMSAVAAACAWQAAELDATVNGIARESGIPLLLLYLSLLALTIVLSALLIFTFVRMLAVIRLKKSSNAFLFSSVGGDKIDKLFPVPGTTFMTRGR